MKKVRLLVCADGVTQTGFSRVAHSIVKHLPQDFYEINWLAINYFGDPHDYPYKIYPASSKGDIYGINRLGEFKDWQPDVIFLINDAWVLQHYLKKIKEVFKDIMPRIVVYLPVDAENHMASWYEDFDCVTQLATYSNFGKEVIQAAVPKLNPLIIPHGVDNKVFYKINAPKMELKKILFPNTPDFYDDSFIILSAFRNQPRKRLDITMEAFKLFSENKPENVKLYMHTGVSDSHINVVELAKRLGIDDRMIVSNLQNGPQQLPVDRLNLIYNATDVGVNTSIGEGWSLPNFEHAITGAPQVVPNHSALTEIYSDCGILVQPKFKWTQDQIMTVGRVVLAEDVADAFERLYSEPQLVTNLGTKLIHKFSNDMYQWNVISARFDRLFREA